MLPYYNFSEGKIICILMIPTMGTKWGHIFDAICTISDIIIKILGILFTYDRHKRGELNFYQKL